MKYRLALVSMLRRYQAAQFHRERGRNGERQRDAADASAPAETVEQLAKQRGADESSGEIAREIDPARRAFVLGRGAADEAGRDGLREEGADADQRESGEDSGEIAGQQQRQADPRQTPERPRARAACRTICATRPASSVVTIAGRKTK